MILLQNIAVEIQCLSRSIVCGLLLFALAPLPVAAQSLATDVRGGMFSDSRKEGITDGKVPENFKADSDRPKKQSSPGPVATEESDSSDSFAIPESEANAAKKLQNLVRSDLLEQQLPKRTSRFEHNMVLKAKKDSKVRVILDTLDKVSKRLQGSAYDEEGNRKTISERIREASDQADRVADPSIEREEKAKSNRF